MNQDPVHLLKELFGNSVQCTSTMIIGAHNKGSFEVIMKVNGNNYTATGTDFQLARKSAALVALASLSDVQIPVPSIKTLAKGNGVVVNETNMGNVLASRLNNKNELKAIEYKPIDANKSDDSNKINICNDEIETLTIEEIEEDSPTLGVVAKTKPLQNISNIPVTNKANFGKKSNTVIVSQNPNTQMVSSNSNLQISSFKSNLNAANSKAKTGRAKKKAQHNLSFEVLTTTTTKTLRTLNCVVQTTNTNTVCVRSFARNPISFEEPLPSCSNEIVNASQASVIAVISQHAAKPNLKRKLQMLQGAPSNNIESPAKKKPCEVNNVRQLTPKKRHLFKTWSQQNRNPTEVLSILCPELKFNLESEMGSSHSSFYMMSVMINDRKYFGHGKTEKLAKRDIATQVLKYFKTIGYVPKIVPEISVNNNQQVAILSANQNINNVLHNNFSSLQLPQLQADIVEQLIMAKFNQLARGRQEIRDYKVLAGIVMTCNLNFQEATVITIATGTKCINGGNICLDGLALNDCHAEVIAKRCLIKFLYTQLKWHFDPDPKFAQASIFNRNSNGFALKPNMHFHLYISTAPCGDGRIFSFNDGSSKSTGPSFNSAQYGKLRTKVEGGLGTTPVGNNYSSQTWDGVMAGEPLLTMSCSDKIARWNVLGIQGSLLSTLVEPIYLHSIVLGSMLNPQHMYRAICGRIEQTLAHLPPPYHLNRPLLGQTSQPSSRNTYKAPTVGMNWTLLDEDVEMIFQPTGRQIFDETSSVAKQIFFNKYRILLENLPVEERFKTLNYAEAKSFASDYQFAKNALFAAFQHAELGCWIKKPAEQNEFISMI